MPGETKIHVRATKYNCSQSHSSFAFRNVCKHTLHNYEYLNFVGNGFESLGSLLFEYWAVLLSAMQYTVLFSLLYWSRKVFNTYKRIKFFALHHACSLLNHGGS